MEFELLFYIEDDPSPGETERILTTVIKDLQILPCVEDESKHCNGEENLVADHETLPGCSRMPLEHIQIVLQFR